MKNHNRFYSFAEIYDVAFDFKDIPKECQFLHSVFSFTVGREPRSFIDLAAGPALHAIEMARYGLECAALDLSQEMVEYGLTKARKAGMDIQYTCGDLCSFRMSRTFDIAGIFMDSTSYLLTNESVLSHLSSVASVLNSGGIYVLEMSHPRDVFSIGSSTENAWEIEKDGIWTSVVWGHKSDTFDPISQITDTTVRLKFKKNGVEHELVEKAPQRCFTANEFMALVKAEGSFDILSFYGAMDIDVPFTTNESSWRMVPVLQKRVNT
jgi:ubiquinone/menaquinone biosynthesis C-methylase UbiE